MKQSFALFSAVLLSLAAFCQDTTWVHNIHFKAKPFERRYLQYTTLQDGKVKLSALLTRKAELNTINGRQTLLVIQSYQFEKGVDTDSSYVDPVTLLPQSYHTDIQSEGHRERVIFAGGSIDNTVQYKDSTTRFTRPDSGWYNGVITDDIISSLPLKANTTFAFRAINPGKRYFEYTVAITVEGKEELEIPGLGKIMCWRIRIGEANGGTTEWYTVKEQIQVKKQFRFRNGNIFYRVMMLH